MAQPQVPSNAEQFKQSFREEAREILTELESSLLELNENPSDTELVSRIFRGLHTIKGSGAMFGFERLAAFMHDLETAFDLVRSGRLQISSELIDLTLSALDQIRAMLEEGIGGATPADAAACAAILVSVRKLAAIEERADAAKKSEPAPDRPAVPAGDLLFCSANCASWASFRPGPSWTRCLRSAKSIPSGATSGGRWIWPRVRAGRRFAMSSFLSKTCAS